MRTGKESKSIQPDSRGRIQLPKEFREIQLFELENKGNMLILYPLDVSRRDGAVSTKDVESTNQPWLNEDISRFLESTMIPKLKTFFTENSPAWLHGIFLFGSRARADALSNSDFDFCFVCDPFPSFRERSEFTDLFLVKAQDLHSELERHGVNGEFNVQFVKTPHQGVLPPTLYFNIAEDGRIIWQRNGKAEEWLQAVNTSRKRAAAKAEGSGKARKWKWKKM